VPESFFEEVCRVAVGRVLDMRIYEDAKGR
jgi:hypothetical protein